MDSLYKEFILEEYKDPQNKGLLEDATHSHEEDNPLCGDRITAYLRIVDGVIDDIRWDGVGCAISQASASLFSEHIRGKKLSEVESMDEQVILDLLGIEPNPMRMKCAVLIMKTIAGALEE